VVSLLLPFFLHLLPEPSWDPEDRATALVKETSPPEGKGETTGGDEQQQQPGQGRNGGV